MSRQKKIRSVLQFHYGFGTCTTDKTRDVFVSSDVATGFVCNDGTTEAFAEESAACNFIVQVDLSNSIHSKLKNGTNAFDTERIYSWNDPSVP